MSRNNTYICGICEEEFEFLSESEWSDKNKMEELERNFGPNAKNTLLEIICDDCYKLLIKVSTN